MRKFNISGNFLIFAESKQSYFAAHHKNYHLHIRCRTIFEYRGCLVAFPCQKRARSFPARPRIRSFKFKYDERTNMYSYDSKPIFAKHDMDGEIVDI